MPSMGKTHNRGARAPACSHAERNGTASVSESDGILTRGYRPRALQYALCLTLLALVPPARADIQFHARPLTNAKLPRGKAQCEIRLIVDKQVEVSLHGDTVGVHTLIGADARDNGSECSAPLPERVVDDFILTVKKKHGEVRLVSDSTKRNNFTATVFIHNNPGGDGAYDLRISWSAPPTGAITANNATHTAAPGAGKAALNETAPVVLGNVTVDMDLGGKVMVTFQVGRSGSASFTGSMMSRDAGVTKVDATADERFLHLPGPMYLYFDASKQIYKIAMDATNGQDQLRVNWERK
jgi:hypothetical protein